VSRVGSNTDEEGVVPAPDGVGESFTDAFTKAILAEAERDERVVAITAAMPGPTGLLSFEEHFPGRFFDVGIAEQHAMTAAAGMALQGLKPVVAIYSTFLARCVDQWNLDVGLHGAPVVVVADRAGITGDDGPSHHGIYDLVQALQIPGCAVFCPSEPAEIAPALGTALALGTPALVRYPKTPSPGPLGQVGEAMAARVLVEAGEAMAPGEPVAPGEAGKPDDVVLVGIGKMARNCVEAARLLAGEGLAATVFDPRVVRPADPAMLERLAAARLVVTAEDGLAHGGAGAYLARLVEEVADGRGLARPRTLVLGVPTAYLAHGRPDDILAGLGLDGAGIAASVRDALERLESHSAH
jgi:1-deoxy-D-xylulose-5-phosphate synthase